jgi:chromosomal replication initiator protein
MARRFELVLSPEVQEFVAARLCNHARELSGALCRLRASRQVLGRAIDMPMAEEALAEMIQHSSRVVRLPDIEKAVCEVLGVDAASLQSSGKSKGMSHPRMLAMWLARKHTRAALCEIGTYFGRRTHSTVISAQKRIEQWRAAGGRIEAAQQRWSLDEAIRQVEKRLIAS